ncbi:UDP-N-acetylglucosamine-N-acetylmuramylpentapeptide N-acetylglucosamine transferase [Pontibacter ummariensis]|uniref:UDP-N-acetylglucosamine--N-acetylmuramyl-(pentapeptide) pyrophosphoryl-undecaprenol N-acetylglucosamine transferase n=1 Tax=Pontibacter ummariensis TaxID=1610492 RepID=A0A239EVA0_9BACT|nr:undecaprenyldiphospho-muramoylpentapeptide beta-N-acetylglucosaminyltransferase [Pontibacter ummariensis]PRY12728.1 UDP-N-acetylglucosamine-N-acetylmuramylpentapeptide N-acetylglucosamine transferase [Pontibacter ummariensis]SNS48596.1 UDP-N-acetylglucosamine-N-acetylmuramylpentapeptide N-acetylglucosamine transferase [Pontibacter ummariensis]
MPRSERPYRVIISGGGTGGHIYPAVAIANQLKAVNPEAEILFVGAKGRMEMTRVPEAGYKIVGLWISGLQRRLTLDNLSFPLKVLSSVRASHKIIKEFKPDAVVGVGGYASGPLLYAATSRGIPALIQEQNSYAGITNKLLAKRVDKVCVAYPNMEAFFPAEKLVLTGNPVRSDILDSHLKREEALGHFGLQKDKKVILVIGGSLGARTINRSVATGLAQIVEGGYQLVWQTGKAFFPEAKALEQQFEGKGIYAFDFIKRMDLAYAAADVVISRAGALSISELCLAGKPAVLVPSPNVAEDHQTKNAMALVEQEAALLVRDTEAGEKLIPTTLQLAQDEQAQQRLRRHILKMARPNAAADIVNELIKLIG